MAGRDRMTIEEVVRQVLRDATRSPLPLATPRAFGKHPKTPTASQPVQRAREDSSL
jgi:hypothetical protein